MKHRHIHIIVYKYLIVHIFIGGIIPYSFSQTPVFTYYKNSYVMIPTTDSLYEAGEYRKSIEYNLQQLDSAGNLIKVKSYIIAQNYALLGMNDSAFFYLNYYIDSIHPSDYRSIYVDQDFELLRNDEKAWCKLIDRIENLYLLELSDLMNKEMALKLFRLEIEDQKYRSFRAASCRRGNGISLQESIYHTLDNQKKLEKIIKKYGFPTPSKVGYTATLGAFYVLQHSMIKDKYYKMAKKAYEEGDYIPQCYALLTDRWLRQNNKKQIYGTQFISIRNEDGSSNPLILEEVEDFPNLNHRRAELGLPPIEQYVKKIKGYIPKEYYEIKK